MTDGSQDNVRYLVENAVGGPSGQAMPLKLSLFWCFNL